ncbi:MAG: Cof-type HAD-IIB family hydrolase [Candidatus Izemoplasmataceae bacterium]
MRKLIFLDLDGTILDHSTHTIPKSAKQAIDQARTNGHDVILATGRPPSLMGRLLEEIHFDAVVGANGRYITYKDKVLHKDAIPRTLLESFIKDADEDGVELSFLGTKDFFTMRESSEYAVRLSEYYHLPHPKYVEDPGVLNDVLQVILFFDDLEIVEKYQTKYPDLDFNLSSPFSADVNTKDGLKEIGIDVFTEYLGVPVSQTVAIGDSYNDISMIEHAGIGVAMGNGCEPLKEVADHVTDTVSNDGLYKAFKTLKLI